MKRQNKIIIGVDGNEANLTDRVGVNQYAFELLWAICRLSGEWKERFKFVIYLSQKPLNDLPSETSFWRYQVLPGKRFWILTSLMPRLVFNPEKLDLFFTPSHYLPLIGFVPKVCSIMDLGYLEFTGQFKKYDFWQLKYWTAISLFISNQIISISNKTKEDIVRHYPFTRGKITVTPLAFDQQRFNLKISDKEVSRVKKKYSLKDDYVLFLSTLKPNKNVEGLLTAWQEIENDFPETQLVIAGKKGWLYNSIFQKAQELGLEKRVVFTDFVPEKDKPGLYKGAKLFVLPSFFEGFGLVALEAMACGISTIVSNRGSLPEAVGAGAIQIDPESTSELAEKMKKVLLMNQMEYNQLVKKGLAQAQEFSWEKTARSTLAVFDKALG